jgi:hypothetical protein
MNICIFILTLLCNFYLCVNAMRFHEYFLHKLRKTSLDTEEIAYELLKKAPISKKINYLVVPWPHLFYGHKLNKLNHVKIKGGFTISHFDYPEQLVRILKKIGINVLFTPNASNKFWDPNFLMMPFPHIAINGAPAKQKHIFYSFIGNNTHAIRRKIFNMRHPMGTVIKERKTWHFHIHSEVRKEKEKNEYQKVLSASRYSLCPRGKAIGTIRFWESLQAGAIPVVISDDLLLPTTFNWDECIVRIAEKDVYKIHQTLAKISWRKEYQMRKNCMKAYELFSGDNLISVIRDFYKKPSKH